MVRLSSGDFHGKRIHHIKWDKPTAVSPRNPGRDDPAGRLWAGKDNLGAGRPRNW